MGKSLLLGSVFEASLRVLLLLDQLNGKELDEEQITYIDFLAINSRDFALLDKNLNGDGPLRLAEFSAKKNLIASAIKDLVVSRLINFNTGSDGFIYSINSVGRSKVRSFTSDYSKNYRASIISLIESNPNLDSDKLRAEVYKAPLEKIL